MLVEFIWTSSHPNCRIPLTVCVPLVSIHCYNEGTFPSDIMRNQVEVVLMPHETQMTATPKLWSQPSPSSEANSLISFHYPQ